ncbi:MAG: glycosyltransferase [Desulfobulbaceae bacterium]|nr:glycosyltransferase [Desulfobulbaceae bacterium]
MEKKSLHLVHTVSSVSEEASGPSYSVVRLCESLISQGNDVRLATLVNESHTSSPHFLQPFLFGQGPRRLGRSPDMNHWLSEIALAGAVDLIHSHGLWMMPNIYPGRVAHRYNIPLMVAPRGMLSEWAMQNGSFMKRIIWPLLQRPALDATICFHATSEQEYLDIRRLGFKQPVCVIPNGIDVPMLKKTAIGGRKILMFLGRIHPKKGVDILLRAWRVVQQRFPGWELHVIGPDNGRYLTTMKALVAQLRLERVVFVGPLYGKDKLRAYRNASLFVLPTHSENFGLTVAEALAASTPVIVTKGAPWDGLEIERAGWWIDIGVDPLVECLEQSMAEPESRLAEMGKAGREWMIRDFSWEKIGEHLSMVYRWVLEGGKAPQSVRND